MNVRAKSDDNVPPTDNEPRCMKRIAWNGGTIRIGLCNSLMRSAGSRIPSSTWASTYGTYYLHVSTYHVPHPLLTRFPSTARRAIRVGDGLLEREKIFGKYADLYDAYRPHYPDKMFDIIMSHTARYDGTVSAIDVATGTGRSAFELVRRGADVVATDIDKDMIEAAIKSGGCTGSEQNPSFIVSEAEKLSSALKASNAALDTRRFDVATVMQAWHWFDSPAVLRELRDRVLRPNGILAVAWNDRDIGIPWVSEFETLMERFNDQYSRHERQCDDYETNLTQDDQFELIEYADIPHEMPVDSGHTLLDISRTYSYVRNVLDARDDDDANGWSSWKRDLAGLVETHHGSIDSPFVLPLRTRLYILRSTAT